MLKEIKNIINNFVVKSSSLSEREVKKHPSSLTDTVSISPEARKVSEKKVPPPQNISVLKDIDYKPLVREEKITQAKQRLSSSFYDDKIEETVELLFNDLFK